MQAKYFATIKPADGDDPGSEEVQQEIRKAKASGRRGLSAPVALRHRFGALLSRNGDLRKFVGSVRQAFHLANQGFTEDVKNRMFREVLTEGSAVSASTLEIVETAEQSKALDRHAEREAPSGAVRLDDRIRSETAATVRRLRDPRHPVLSVAVLGEATALFLMGAFKESRAVFAAAL